MTNQPSKQQSDIQLSPTGHERRLQMRQSIAGELTAWRRARERRRQLGVAAILVGAVIWGSWSVGFWQNRPAVDGEGNSTQMASNHNAESSSNIADANADADLEFELIDDDELLELLRQSGNPSHLVRIDGQLVLLPERKSL